MQRNALICTPFACLLLIAGCHTASNHDADVKAIQDGEAQWVQDFASRDVNKIVAHYADDAILMMPGAPAATNPDAIRGLFQGALNDPAFSLKFSASQTHVAASGDLAATRGTYVLQMTNPATKQPMQDHGSYVTVYRKYPDNTWKAIDDITTSEAPATPPPSR